MTSNKTVLLTRINALRKELDELVDFVISLEETQPIEAISSKGIDTDKFLTVQQVCELLQISDSTFYEHLRLGLLPPGISFGPRSKRWRISDIREWQKRKQSNATVNVIIPEPVKRRDRPSKVRRKEEFYV